MAPAFARVVLVLGASRGIIEGCHEVELHRKQQLLEELQRRVAKQEARIQRPTCGRCPNPSCKLVREKVAKLEAASRLPAASSRLGGEGRLRARISELELQLSELQHTADVRLRDRTCADRAVLEAAATHAASKVKLARVQAAAAQQVAAADEAATKEAAAARKAALESEAVRKEAASAVAAAAAEEKARLVADKGAAEARAALQAAEARAVEREERSRVRGLEAQLRESEQSREQQLTELLKLRAAAATHAREVARLQLRSKELTSINISTSKTGQRYQVCCKLLASIT